jgi:hypothetical protein
MRIFLGGDIVEFFVHVGVFIKKKRLPAMLALSISFGDIIPQKKLVNQLLLLAVVNSLISLSTATSIGSKPHNFRTVHYLFIVHARIILGFLKVKMANAGDYVGEQPTGAPHLAR